MEKSFIFVSNNNGKGNEMSDLKMKSESKNFKGFCKCVGKFKVNFQEHKIDYAYKNISEIEKYYQWLKISND